MSVLKPVGNGAASRKYDLLTALGAMALASSPVEQRLVLRLILAITARYNWATDTLAVAQADLARMWSVDERTVKRVMAEFRAREWLKLKRASARGRVAEYGLGIDELLVASRPDWARVGRDFEARMNPQEGQAAVPQAEESKIVRFPASAPTEAPQGQVWPRMLTLLAAGDPATARAWMQGITEEGIAGGTLMLRTKGRYQANYLRTHLMGRLMGAARRLEPRVQAIEIGADDA